MPKGFFYLVAIMDWHSRKVLSWRLSNTMDAIFCVEALEEALALYGRPEIFNSDQGAQFTSTAFTGVLEAAGVRISMDGKGRCMDNVFVERLWRSLKYEETDSSSVANTTSAQGAGEVDAEATTEADSGRPGCDRFAAERWLGRAGDCAGAWPLAQRDQYG